MTKYLMYYLFKFLIWLRYRVVIKGKDKLTPENLKKAGGMLFLPNHTAIFIDPVIIFLSLFKKFPIKPLIADYLYFNPSVYKVMNLFDALPVPDFETSINSWKKNRNENLIKEVSNGLKKGENFLLYPSGRVKHTSLEKVGGSSATHRIIEDTPEANIVLVKIKGLWGSGFSRALTGQTPNMFQVLKERFWDVLKNLIFFTPRREVVVEFVPAPPDFPYKASRLELNQWLDEWYNRPEDPTQEPGEPLVLVSYSAWKKKLPKLIRKKEEGTLVELRTIPIEIQNKVIQKIHEMIERDPESIKPPQDLASDLGMDSLDKSELALFLQEEFKIKPPPVTELTTVESLMAFAAGKITFSSPEEATKTPKSAWEYKGPYFRGQIADGDTMPQVLFNICRKMGSSPGYADMRSGVVSYKRVKIGAILLAEYIRHLPGKYIGIMLPASVGALLTALACQIAGKVPMMVNWTMGPRHLEAVNNLSKAEVILSSWAFLDRLNHVDLGPIQDKLVLLETVKYDFSLKDKIQALLRSRKSDQEIFKIFGIDQMTKNDEAVLLFTSGTESLPKGVPLSHDNILSNQRAGLKLIEINSHDVLFSFLPPFHSFGYCITGLMGFLAGVRTAFYPNPIDGRGMAAAFEYWGGTIVCGAPTFLKAMLKGAKPGQLNTMRFCMTGAEKTPPDLIDLLGSIGKDGCLVEGYGVTECAPIITANIPGEPLRGVGKPLSGVSVIIIHPETHEVLPQGEKGLILASGPNIFSGYLNSTLSPFLTIEDKKWYNTGDIGYIDEGGYVHISGRLKRFLKIGGEMVSLLGIEAAILESGKKSGWPISQEGPSLAIIAKETAGEKPIILLVSTFDVNLDEANQVLRQSGFSNLIRVSDVVKVQEIPIMGTGKINYRLLEEKYLNY